MKVMTRTEYYNAYPEMIGQDSPEFDDVVKFYVSDHEGCPYIGVEYSDGEVWVYGARTDHRVEDGDELEWYLNQE